jgi:hypothetical protein
MGIGLLIAKFLGRVLREFLDRIKAEKFMAKHGIHDAFVGFTLTDIATILLELYILVIFLGIAAGAVNVPILYTLALQATAYMPMLVQGVIILMVGLIAGDYITDRMKESKKIPFANSLAIVVEIFIAYNALVIALPLLLPSADPSLLMWSFLVVLAAFGLALGIGAAIAIGLGTKDVVAEVAKKHKGKFDSLL